MEIMEQISNLPIGIQSFEDIRTRDFKYVDKTRYVYNLVSFAKSYFLSRPRRFGKSLFLSTLKAYFEGKKELFRGLELEELEIKLAKIQNREEWVKHPVLYLDFNVGNFTTLEDFKSSLAVKLSDWEDLYGISGHEAENMTHTDRFALVIKTAYEKSGRQVVVLVDEYDKPLLNVVENEKLLDSFRALLKSFYGVIKGYDQYICFAFLTGVTRFDKVSIFSDLNNLIDISMSNEFAAVCGYTQEELESNFALEIEILAKNEGISREECLLELKEQYDGYIFSSKPSNIYNPFSVMSAFKNCEFGSYWFATGTPTFLVKMMQKTSFPLETIEDGIDVDGTSLEGYRLNSELPVPMLYQTGYLTIKAYEKDIQAFTLGFPNNEVRYGFLKCLIPYYAGFENGTDKIEIVNFIKEIRSGQTEEFMKRIQSIFAAAPKKTSQKYYELDAQAFFWLIFKLIGQFIQCEVQNGEGRSDAVVWTKDSIYVFEFKLDGSAEEAIEQIKSKNYAIPYQSDGRKLVLIGANFSSETKNLTGWVVE